MEGWLLNTDALVEFLMGSGPVVEWAKTKTGGQLFVSEISWATLRGMAQADSNAVRRDDWLELVDREVPRTFGARLLPVNRVTLQRWSLFAADKTAPKASIDESISIATALAHSLVYVTRDSELAKYLRVDTESPWK